MDARGSHSACTLHYSRALFSLCCVQCMGYRWMLFSLICCSCALATLCGMIQYDRTPRLLLLRIWALGRFCSCSTGVVMVAVVLVPLVCRDPIHV